MPCRPAVLQERIDESIEGVDLWLAQQGVPLSLRAALRDLQGELGGLATRGRLRLLGVPFPLVLALLALTY